MKKRYVGMEAKICPVCGKKHNHECGILLDKNLRKNLEMENITGYGLCEEHDKLFKEGYLAIVEVDEEKSIMNKGKIKIENAYKTGKIAHLKREVAKQLLNMEINDELDFVFSDKEFLDKLENLKNEK